MTAYSPHPGTRTPVLIWYLFVQFCAIAVVAAYKPLSDSFLLNVPSGGADFDPENGLLLAPLLKPRVPGTAEHQQVQQHFVKFFARELPTWTVEWHNASHDMPVSNLVARREPPWTKPGQANFLTFAAHYDSRVEPKGYVGATASAVSCATLMHIARSIDKYITQMHVEMAALGEGGTVEMDMGVQIILLDRKEEVGGSSLFGSRALTESWEAKTNPATSPYHNPLSQISVFVLLDLLGSANPIVQSQYLETHWAYKNMASIEDRLRKLGLLESRSPSAFFDTNVETNPPSDNITAINDHVPFLSRGVPVIPIFPSTVPAVYGTMDDNGKNLDLPTVRDWTRIVTAFALEWLDMMEVWPDEV